MSEVVYYAVQRGRKPGVYAKWKDALEQTSGFKYPKFRKFYSLEEAQRFAFPNLYPDAGFSKMKIS
jgi:viroplasmin and RNaseH domain-containing protein